MKICSLEQNMLGACKERVKQKLYDNAETNERSLLKRLFSIDVQTINKGALADLRNPITDVMQEISESQRLITPLTQKGIDVYAQFLRAEEALRNNDQDRYELSKMMAYTSCGLYLGEEQITEMLSEYGDMISRGQKNLELTTAGGKKSWSDTAEEREQRDKAIISEAHRYLARNIPRNSTAKGIYEKWFDIESLKAYKRIGVGHISTIIKKATNP